MPPITVVATGDTIVLRPFVDYPDAPFQDLHKIIRDADVAFTNLEIPLSDLKGSRNDWFTISTDPRIAGDLRKMGFDIISYANNHAFNFGEPGFLLSLAALRKEGIPFAGAGDNLHEARRPAYVEVPAGRVGLIAMTSTWYPSENAIHQERDRQGRPGVNPVRHDATYIVDGENLDGLAKAGKQTRLAGRRVGLFKRPVIDPEPGEPNVTSEVMEFGGHRFAVGTQAGSVISRLDAEDYGEIMKWVKEIRTLSDVALVSVHCHEAGVESPNKITPPQFLIQLAHAAVDNGADMVIGHGPHRQMGMQMYKGKPIFWGLGDFIWQVEYMQSKLGDYYMTPEMRDWTPHEYHSKFIREQEIRDDQDQWDLVLPEVVYDDHVVKEIRLHAATLGWGEPLPHRGAPRMASAKDAERIMKKFAEMSRAFGTEIVITGDKAHVKLS